MSEIFAIRQRKLQQFEKREERRLAKSREAAEASQRRSDDAASERARKRKERGSSSSTSRNSNRWNGNSDASGHHDDDDDDDGLFSLSQNTTTSSQQSPSKKRSFVRPATSKRRASSSLCISSSQDDDRNKTVNRSLLESMLESPDSAIKRPRVDRTGRQVDGDTDEALAEPSRKRINSSFDRNASFITEERSRWLNSPNVKRTQVFSSHHSNDNHSEKQCASSQHLSQSSRIDSSLGNSQASVQGSQQLSDSDESCDDLLGVFREKQQKHNPGSSFDSTNADQRSVNQDPPDDEVGQRVPRRSSSSRRRSLQKQRCNRDHDHDHDRSSRKNKSKANDSSAKNQKAKKRKASATSSKLMSTTTLRQRIHDALICSSSSNDSDGGDIDDDTAVDGENSVDGSVDGSVDQIVHTYNRKQKEQQGSKSKWKKSTKDRTRHSAMSESSSQREHLLSVFADETNRCTRASDRAESLKDTMQPVTQLQSPQEQLQPPPSPQESHSEPDPKQLQSQQSESMQPKRTEAAEHDALWSDSDSGNDTDNSHGNMESPKRNHQEHRGKDGMSTPRKKRHSTSPKRSKPSPSRSNVMLDDYDGFNHKHYAGMLQRPMEELRKMLHPTLAQPHFGPFELKPLLLRNTTGEETACDTHQVPASLSRYLPEFQREGIQFMYEAICRKHGVIIGDDMGCGKTLQVIALLAALFNRKGTAEDLLQLHHRRDRIRTKIKAWEQQKEQALMQGRLIAGIESVIDDDFKKQTLKLERCPVIIIVPVSTIDNWKAELSMWAHFGVATFASNPAQRSIALQMIHQGQAEILLVSKSMFQQKFAELKAIDWKLIIIDEFHIFKNKNGTLSRNLRDLKTPNSLVIGMTGTLMQNEHKELWNLIDLVEEGFLGTWDDFKSRFGMPIKYGRSKNADRRVIEASEKTSQELNQKLSTVFIQRLKTQVLADSLPEKNEQVVLCELSPLQKKIYEHILSLPDFELLRYANSPCDCTINKTFFEQYMRQPTRSKKMDFYRRNKRSITKRKKCCYRIPLDPNHDGADDATEAVIDPNAVLWLLHKQHQGDKAKKGCEHCPFCCLFPALYKLYKLSSHVALLQAKQTPSSSTPGSDENIKYTQSLQFAKVAFPKEVQKVLPGGLQRQPGVMHDHSALSGKMKVLAKLLDKFSAEGSKVLIFSASTQTLDLIESYVRVNYAYSRMDGTTPPAQREQIADNFRKKPEIVAFLLSTKAMGLGINLVEANKVIIFDVEWNPSWDQQAQDRSFRIGQTKNVQVLRLVSRGTIDELKYLRQLYKVQLKHDTLKSGTSSTTKRMFRGVQGDNSRRGELFGTENLFKFKDGAFLDDIWRSKNGRKNDDKNKPNGKKKGSKSRDSDLKIHGALELHKSLNEIGSDRCDEILAEEPSLIFPLQCREVGGTTKARGASGLDAKEADDECSSAMDLGVGAMNHADFVNEDAEGGDNGGATSGVEEDEEMGMETQNMVSLAGRGLSNRRRRSVENQLEAIVETDSDESGSDDDDQSEGEANSDEDANHKDALCASQSDDAFRTGERHASRNDEMFDNSSVDAFGRTQMSLGLDSHLDRRQGAAFANTSKEATPDRTKTKKQRNNVSIMGVSTAQLGNAKTKYSLADFGLPAYGKK